MIVFIKVNCIKLLDKELSCLGKYIGVPDKYIFCRYYKCEYMNNENIRCDID